jgi:hypothetical protein
VGGVVRGRVGDGSSSGPQQHHAVR